MCRTGRRALQLNTCLQCKIGVRARLTVHAKHSKSKTSSKNLKEIQMYALCNLQCCARGRLQGVKWWKDQVVLPVDFCDLVIFSVNRVALWVALMFGVDIGILIVFAVRLDCNFPFCCIVCAAKTTWRGCLIIYFTTRCEHLCKCAEESVRDFSP